MFFSDFVFFLLMVKGVGGQTVMHTESFRFICTNEYPVSHDWESPDTPDWGGLYTIDQWFDSQATPKTCQGWCNLDVTCRSVTYRIYSEYSIHAYSRICTKFSITVQELKDTEKDNEIYTEAATDVYTTFVTYDRECVNATSNTTLTTTTTTTTVLPGAVCIYPVSHDRKAPEWELYHIDDEFLREDNATKETCLDYCNENERCRSTLHIIHGDGRRYCYRFSITVQELKDSERYLDIYTETDTNWAPTYITYDRDCGQCRYPVSHYWKHPSSDYLIGHMRDDSATTKTCQDWCNKDSNCRSVTYSVKLRSRYCYKYNISVQELKDTGRDDQIDRKYFFSYITYDRHCADSPSTTCSDTYPVSHDMEHPQNNPYNIGYIYNDNATAEICQDYCNQDVNCRSVMYETRSDSFRSCAMFSVSVQELKNTGRYNEIYKENTHSIITYDKQCVESLRFMCSNEYRVSHDRQSPDLSYINWLINVNATAKTCWDYCTKDVNCRSVTYQIHSYGRHYCHKYNISVQELKYTGRDNEIYTVTDRDWNSTFITYDKACVHATSNTTITTTPTTTTTTPTTTTESIRFMCTNDYSVSHDSEWPDHEIYRFDYMYDHNATFTAKTCQDYCSKDWKCRSVEYAINSDGWRFCGKFAISVQELKDSGRDNEIYTETDKDSWPTSVTYDRECGECTYPVSHDWKSPATHLQIDWMYDQNATAKTCWGYCNQDMRCRSVLYEIFGGHHYCTKFPISVQELKDKGRDNEIYNGTVLTYITYDRDCVEVSPATKGPGTDGDEVSPATKEPGTNVAAIGEPMIVLIVMIGAGAVFVAPMLPGAEVAF